MIYGMMDGRPDTRNRGWHAETTSAVESLFAATGTETARNNGMPEISRFYGIVIAMSFSEHNPPHFHAQYGGQKVATAIRTLQLLEGRRAA